LLQQSSTAASVDQLPEPLQRVDGYIEGAVGEYTLEWSDEIETYQGLRPITDDETQASLITIRFEGGYSFTCIYTPPVIDPSCTR
jgi:hypothetical protein